MKRATSRRNGGFVPLLVVIVLAAVFWYLFDRPQSTSENGAPASTASITADAVESFSAPDATEMPGAPVAEVQNSTPEAVAPAAIAASTGTPTDLPEEPTPTAAPTRGPPDRIDGLPVITLEELPPQALDTLALIERDGPFPFRQDGTTFQNRERLLPRKPAGYYREYTVITPGASTRGARRIVGGEEGELYYTDDHYASFSRIWMP
ncbi:MAG: ribonuclease domain-containing protein [Caldilinea sp.]